MIEDYSSNGTFVNGQKIGIGKVSLLKSQDIISFGVKENEAFRFIKNWVIVHLITGLVNHQGLEYGEILIMHLLGSKLGF